MNYLNKINKFLINLYLTIFIKKISGVNFAHKRITTFYFPIKLLYNLILYHLVENNAVNKKYELSIGNRYIIVNFLLLTV